MSVYAVGPIIKSSECFRDLLPSALLVVFSFTPGNVSTLTQGFLFHNMYFTFDLCWETYCGWDFRTTDNITHSLACTMSGISVCCLFASLYIYIHIYECVCVCSDRQWYIHFIVSIMKYYYLPLPFTFQGVHIIDKTHSSLLNKWHSRLFFFIMPFVFCFAFAWCQICPSLYLHLCNEVETQKRGNLERLEVVGIIPYFRDCGIVWGINWD